MKKKMIKYISIFLTLFKEESTLFCINHTVLLISCQTKPSIGREKWWHTLTMTLDWIRLGQQTTMFHYDNLCPYEYDRVIIVWYNESSPKWQNSTFDGEVNYQPQNIIIILIYFNKTKEKKKSFACKNCIESQFCFAFALW